MGNRLQNRVAMITGASRGIGKGVARRLGQEGASVSLLDIAEEDLQETAKELESEGISVFSAQVDVTDPEQVESAVSQTVERFGRLDILVNNAGVIRDNLLFKMTDEDWQTVMDVHLKGSFNCSRAAQKVMVEQKYGRIINLSSTSALGNRGQANYSAAKAGLQGFTKTLAIELGKLGITVNAIAPGFIETDMTRATAERIGVSFDAFVEEMKKRIPVQRSGQPEDIANAVVFFAEENSSFVNGQVLYVAGGPTD
ncbi:3-oxoacyl-[acyl-carrier protein] reductase [Melghirimyces thermohalophilus]|uniref:3-oxoacyl-[acyl-carrier protein] reductase n=1 Tax=Melghirimyces thermohalophilus TaxID=1236220 RepID=A0A1G6MQ07_9BACL|nr:3-oxoacyl-ACP reductase FabG [Melghirimyces thermohalophilus]SDC57609.1 3-oxoacyl-[acyl-carrier protein] reductase [Melghirimyces thermohalophilus]